MELPSLYVNPALKKPPLPNCVGKNGFYYDQEHRNTLERNWKPR